MVKKFPTISKDHLSKEDRYVLGFLRCWAPVEVVYREDLWDSLDEREKLLWRFIDEKTLRNREIKAHIKNYKEVWSEDLQIEDYTWDEEELFSKSTFYFFEHYYKPMAFMSELGTVDPWDFKEVDWPQKIAEFRKTKKNT